MEPSAGALSTGEFKVGLSVGVGGRSCFEAFSGVVVQGGRECALLQWIVLRWGQAVSGGNVVVVSGERTGFRRALMAV